MPADRPEEPGAALRAAAARPRRLVDPAQVLRRAEVLRRRRAATRAVAVVALLVPALGAALLLRPGPDVELARADRYGGGTIPATLADTEDPPAALADGRPVGTVPGAVTRRFDEPVVAASVTGALSDRGGCGTWPRAGPPEDLAGENVRFAALQAAAEPAGGVVGPHLRTDLEVGSAAAPPGYPDAYGMACVDAGREGSRGVRFPQHLFTGLTTHHGLADGRAVWTTALALPPSAAWVVQEEPGWWLAYPVAGRQWLLTEVSRVTPDELDAPADVGFPGLRAVMLDAEGGVIAEHRQRDALLEDAPFFADQGVGARIRAGEEDAAIARAAEEPFLACADRVTVCVWLSTVDGELLALSAAGPFPDDVPPVGYVTWCGAADRFLGPISGSEFDRRGAWAGGPPATGMNRYAVTVSGGEAVVDLSRFAFGPQRGDPEPLPELNPTAGWEDCTDAFNDPFGR